MMRKLVKEVLGSYVWGGDNGVWEKIVLIV